MIKKLMRKFGYMSEHDCMKLMHVCGKDFLAAIESTTSISSLLAMLIVWHLFEAAIELLENNHEQYHEGNTPFIHMRNEGIIDPPLAFGIFMTYIIHHPDENHLSLFNLAIRCVKASEMEGAIKEKYERYKIDNNIKFGSINE